MHILPSVIFWCEYILAIKVNKRLICITKETLISFFDFDILLYFQLFSIIVFGCISSSEGFDEGKCPYNNDQNACNYGITIGVLAFLGLIGFLILDAVFETHISSIQHRKYIVMADIAFSGRKYY